MNDPKRWPCKLPAFERFEWVGHKVDLSRDSHILKLGHFCATTFAETLCSIWYLASCCRTRNLVRNIALYILHARPYRLTNLHKRIDKYQQAQPMKSIICWYWYVETCVWALQMTALVHERRSPWQLQDLQLRTSLNVLKQKNVCSHGFHKISISLITCNFRCCAVYSLGQDSKTLLAQNNGLNCASRPRHLWEWT